MKIIGGLWKSTDTTGSVILKFDCKITHTRSYHLKVKIVLLLPFHSVCLFFSFSCLISLARISSIMSNRSSKARYFLVLLLTLQGKLSFFQSLSMMIDVGGL